MDKVVEYFQKLDKVSHLALAIAIAAAFYLVLSNLAGTFVLYFWELFASMLAFAALSVFAWHQVFGPHKMFAKLYQLLFAVTGNESFKINTKVLNDGKEEKLKPRRSGNFEQLEAAEQPKPAKQKPTTESSLTGDPIDN